MGLTFLGLDPPTVSKELKYQQSTGDLSSLSVGAVAIIQVPTQPHALVGHPMDRPAPLV